MPQDTPSRHLDQYLVRFPEGLRNRLKDAAKTNNRSMNAEIIARLEDSFDQSDMSARLDALEKGIEELKAQIGG